jgi:hypothetical protein
MDGNCRAFANSRWAILPYLLLADSLISRIFHHTQPTGTFPSVLFLGMFQQLFKSI